MTTIAGYADTNAQVLLQLGPGGTIWNGSISLSAVLNGVLGGSATTAKPCVKVTGDMNIPDGTVVASVCLGVPTINLLSLIGTSSNSTGQQSIALASDYNNSKQSTLTLYFNGATAATAVATGQG